MRSSARFLCTAAARGCWIGACAAAGEALGPSSTERHPGAVISLRSMDPSPTARCLSPASCCSMGRDDPGRLFLVAPRREANARRTYMSLLFPHGANGCRRLSHSMLQNGGGSNLRARQRHRLLGLAAMPFSIKPPHGPSCSCLDSLPANSPRLLSILPAYRLRAHTKLHS